jgi:GH15 family glucan-1,4-alpha-glucosidase
VPTFSQDCYERHGPCNGHRSSVIPRLKSGEDLLVGEITGRAEQHQGVYGEVLDCAFIYALRGGQISPQLWAELRHIADLAAARWQESDASIWEVRGENQEFTYSKVMCWVALDRALNIAKRLSLSADTQRWEDARRARVRGREFLVIWFSS